MPKSSDRIPSSALISAGSALLGILISFLLIPIWLLLAMEPHYLARSFKIYWAKGEDEYPALSAISICSFWA